MEVIKLNGKREEFDPGKLENTLYRAGAPKEAVNKIISHVKGEVYDGIPTKKLYARVLELLDELQPEAAPCYDLKPAIMRMGPAGYPFETYLARILEEFGYTTKLRTKLEGRCVEHEVDIVGEMYRGDRKVRSLIEVKFHNTSGLYIDLKEALYTYARFFDLNHNHRFEEVWLSCNTKASREAIDYAECMGIKLLCWRYPPGKGLESLIDRKRLYPVTALRKVDRATVTRFSKAGYMLMKDLLEEDYSKLKHSTGLPTRELDRLVAEARNVCWRASDHPFK